MPIPAEYQQALLETLAKLNPKRPGATAYPAFLEAPQRFEVGGSPAGEQEYLSARNYGTNTNPTAISGMSPQDYAAQQQRDVMTQQQIAENRKRAMLEPILRRLLQHQSVEQAHGGSGGMFSLLFGNRQPIEIPGIASVKAPAGAPSNLLNLLSRMNR